MFQKADSLRIRYLDQLFKSIYDEEEHCFPTPFLESNSPGSKNDGRKNKKVTEVQIKGLGLIWTTF